jgi:malonyl CoA-acyl carrier protein transacylase
MTIPFQPGSREVAVVGIGVRGLGLDGTRALVHKLFHGRGPARTAAAPRQPRLLAFAAADEAFAAVRDWNPARSAVFLGLGGTMEGPGPVLASELEDRYAFSGRGGIFRIGDFPANRALEAAIRRIQAGELEGALVGAVDTWTQSASGDGTGPEPPGFAVVLALRDRETALRRGDTLWAVLGSGPVRPRRSIRLDARDFLPGRNASVAGLLLVAVGCLLAGHHVWYNKETQRWEPLLDRTDGIGFQLEGESSGGLRSTTDLWHSFQPGPSPRSFLAAPKVSGYAGDSLPDLLRRVRLDLRGGNGPVRLALLSQDEVERRDLLDRVPALLQHGRTKAGWLDTRVCFSPAPIQGRVASVFSPEGGAYPGMGRELLLGLPILPMFLRGFTGDLSAAGWLFGSGRLRRGEPMADCAGTLFLGQVHAAFSRDILGYRPDVVLGVSLGEVSALQAYGAWVTLEGEVEQLERGGLYSRTVAGTFDAARQHWRLAEDAAVRWQCWTVLGPVEKVQEQAAKEGRAYISLVFSQAHCILAGDSEACRRVLSACTGITAFPCLPLASHTPVLSAWREEWLQHFRRPTRPVPGVEFHSSFFGGPIEWSEERVAAALAGQFLGPLDFRIMAQRAWDDGVRVFLEHGPRDVLTSALKRLLPEGEGLFVALDAQGEPSLQRAVRVAAELWSRGVTVDLDRLESALGQTRLPAPLEDPRLDAAASLFAASLKRTGSLTGAYLDCIRGTQGRFLELLGWPGGEGLTG